MSDVNNFLRDRLPDMLAELERFVRLETPSDEKRLLDAFAASVAEAVGGNDGAEVELVRGGEQGDHVVLRWGDPGGLPILLGHYD